MILIQIISRFKEIYMNVEYLLILLNEITKFDGKGHRNSKFNNEEKKF